VPGGRRRFIILALFEALVIAPALKSGNATVGEIVSSEKLNHRLPAVLLAMSWMEAGVGIEYARRKLWKGTTVPDPIPEAVP
jgi:hypothetical protein